MNVGIAIADVTRHGGPAGIGRHVGRPARTAEGFGFVRIAVMDHPFQTGVAGASEQETPEAYTTPGHLATSTDPGRPIRPTEDGPAPPRHRPCRRTDPRRRPAYGTAPAGRAARTGGSGHPTGDPELPNAPFELPSFT